MAVVLPAEAALGVDDLPGDGALAAAPGGETLRSGDRGAHVATIVLVLLHGSAMTMPVLLWLASLGASAGAAAYYRLRWRRCGELVARACHELRGPLTVVHLALHAGCAGPAAPRPAAIELELHRAGLALEDLMASCDGRRRSDGHDLVDLRELLTDQAATWRAVAAARGRRLRHAAPPGRTVVRGDRVRLAQAVANLLGNAIEHGGDVIVLTSSTERDRVRIEVADDGPGLPASLEALVRRARGGRGWRGRGLAIAGEIARAHGGVLTATSAPGRTRVVLELPACREDDEPCPAAGGRQVDDQGDVEPVRSVGDVARPAAS